MKQVILMNPKDNVVSALADLEAGTRVVVDEHGVRAEVELRDDIPFGHKFAISPMAAGEAVVKYGETIGLATAAIVPGEHVHVHNVESVRGRGDRQ